MARTPRGRKPKAPPTTEPIDNVGATELEGPVFSQPATTPDPTEFEVKHPSDNPVYKQIDALNREHKLTTIPFPAPRDLPEPRLSLAAVLNVQQADLDNQIKKNGQRVFHAVGDTGNTRGPTDQNLVADKLVSDFSGRDRAHAFGCARCDADPAELFADGDRLQPAMRQAQFRKSASPRRSPAMSA
jgi:hypothetical protein